MARTGLNVKAKTGFFSCQPPALGVVTDPAGPEGVPLRSGCHPLSRGIRRAGGARRGRIASVREILPEDGFRPAVRADRAGGGIKILREPLENAAETGERFRRFRRRRRLRRQLRGDRRCDRRSRRRRGRTRFERQPRRRHRPREEHERQTNDDNSFFHCFLLSESVYPAKPFPSTLFSPPSVSTVTP